MRLFAITEDDLKVLEECVPQLVVRIGERTNNRDRVMIRRVQQVITDVRWDYQPHSEIEDVPNAED